MDLSRLESTSGDNTMVRSLGSLERWFTLMDAHIPNHFSMVAQLEGRSYPEQWRFALDQLQRRHHLLRVSIRQSDDGDLDFVYCDTPIALNIVKRGSSAHWKDEAVRQLSNRFDISSGPLVRVLLLLDEARCDLVITVHHAIADGLSVSCLIRDLLEAVSGNQLRELALPASQCSLLESSAQAADSNLDIASDPAEAPQAMQFEFRSNFALAASLDTLSMSRVETNQIMSMAREERTTVHAALLAALVLAGRQLSVSWAENGVEGFTPISIRNHLSIGDDCVVALSAGGTLLNPKPNCDLWTLAREAKVQLRPQQEMQGITKTLKYFDFATTNNRDSMAVAQAAANVIGFKLMLTNLGKLSFQTDTPSLKLGAIWGPVINLGFQDEQTVGAVTVNGALHLTHTSYAPLRPLLRNAVALLVEASKRHAA